MVIAFPAIAYGALVWKTSLRPDRLASIERLVAQFDQVVFQFVPEKASMEPVRKWTKRVRIRIIGDDADKWRPVVERHMATFADLAGIKLFPMYLLPVTGEIFLSILSNIRNLRKL